MVSLARAETGADHVHVDLLANTAAIQPGRSFTVGVRFKIDPGWHIYWTNPGDSGLATTVKLDLPPDFKAEDVQYPVPEVLKLPGNITNYAYEREVTLLVRIVPPAMLTTPVPIVAHVDYLVCSQTCMPGHGTAAVLLPAGPEAEANRKLFDAWNGRLPRRPPPGFSAEFVRKAAPDDSSFHIQIKWPADAASTVKDVQWLPPALPGFDLEDVRVATHDGVTEVDYKLTQLGRDKRPERVDSLILYKQPNGAQVAFPLSIYPDQLAGSSRGFFFGSGS